MCSVVRTDRETDSQPDGTSDDEEAAHDDRIQAELDKLNQASSEINQFENELDEARTKYRSTVSETSRKMEAIGHNQTRSIRRAREYYRLLEEKKMAQAEALKAARQYQTATGVYNAAKETVALAEQRLVENTDSAAAQLTSAWQEMLNHATSKVMEAEKGKTRSEQDHKRRALKFVELEGKIKTLEKKFSRSIKNAKPYFDMKSELDLKLQQQKQNVNDLQAAIRENKKKYNLSLRNLEKISEEIHQSRRSKIWSMVPRMPCVGAETDSIASGLSEMTIDPLGFDAGSVSGDTGYDDISEVDLELTDAKADFTIGGSDDSPRENHGNDGDLADDLVTSCSTLPAVKNSSGETAVSASNIDSNSTPEAAPCSSQCAADRPEILGSEEKQTDAEHVVSSQAGAQRTGTTSTSGTDLERLPGNGLADDRCVPGDDDCPNSSPVVEDGHSSPEVLSDPALNVISTQDSDIQQDIELDNANKTPVSTEQTTDKLTTK